MIATDTHWRCEGYCNHMRGYCSQQREVTFKADTTRAEIEAWVQGERSRWHGQIFNARELSTLNWTLSRAVDSGD